MNRCHKVVHCSGNVETRKVDSPAHYSFFLRTLYILGLRRIDQYLRIASPCPEWNSGSPELRHSVHVMRECQ